MWVVSFMPRPLYHPERDPSTHYRRLGGPQSRSERGDEGNHRLCRDSNSGHALISHSKVAEFSVFKEMSCIVVPGRQQNCVKWPCWCCHRALPEALRNIHKADIWKPSAHHTLALDDSTVWLTWLAPGQPEVQNVDGLTEFNQPTDQPTNQPTNQLHGAKTLKF